MIGELSVIFQCAKVDLLAMRSLKHLDPAMVYYEKSSGQTVGYMVQGTSG